ncbi:MAG: CHAD domain-containing protein [Verrucomicrobiota bacterium]
MRTPPEYELKFEIDPPQATRLLRQDWLREMLVGNSAKRHLRTIYYDTPDWQLRHAGISFRIRKSGHQFLQCVKSMPTETHKSIARDEFEIPVPDNFPHPESIPDENLPFDRSLCDRLEPVFEIDVHRTIRTLQPDPETEFELAVDKGEVRCGDETSHPFCEVELELRRGPPSALFETARHIVRSVPVRMGVLYKSDRGYRLAASPNRPWQKSERITLSNNMTAEDALVTMVLSCLRQLRQNEQFAVETNNPESVHQFRVALRRLRSVLRLYKPNLPAKQYTKFKNVLKWISERSGAVRDWDVFLEQRLDPVRSHYPDLSALDTLADQAAIRRRHAQSSFTRALRSTRYARFLIDLYEWIHERQWREQPVTEESAALFSPLHEFADAKLRKLQDKVHKKGRKFRQLSDQDRHKLRIAIKKLRYACEFFRSLYSKKNIDKRLKRLKRLQDYLGELNDIANLPARAEMLLATPSAEKPESSLAYAAGLLVGWHSAHKNRILKKAGKQFRKLHLDF